MAATRIRDPQPDFAELDVVRLRAAIYDDGRTIPIGTLGTVVFRHTGGEAFEVEFIDPVNMVVTLRPWDLAGAA